MSTKKHIYAVRIRDAKTKKNLGRLGADGAIATKLMFACMFETKEHAADIADDINDLNPDIIAEVIKW